jgi:ATP-binding cassette subfamily C protein
VKILSDVQASLSLLAPADRRRYRLAVAAQVTLASLDLLGVLLIGALGLLTAAAATNSPVPSGVQGILDRLGLEGWSTASVAILFGGLAAVLLIAKSVLSLYVQRRTALFLARRSRVVSSRLVGGFLSQSLLEVQKRPATWTTYAFIEGLSSAVSGVLNQFMVIVGDMAVLFVVGAALLILDPVTTVVVAGYFGLVIVSLNRWLGPWSARVSRQSANASIQARDAINDAIVTYRETMVSGRRDFFRERFIEQRWLFARAAADNVIISAIPRFGMEVALTLGGALLVLVLLLTGGSTTEAVGSLALFLAAVARFMPSLLRLNAASIMMQANAANAERTLELFTEIQAIEPSIPPLKAPAPHASGPLSVEVRGVSLMYPERDTPALIDVDLVVPAGHSVALVGPTGAGKSSLVDVILGVLPPTSGEVLIDGLSPQGIVARHPGALAYVPQSVAIVHGAVRDNVALGLPDVEDDRVWAALDRAHLGDFVRSLPERLDSLVGERGVRLSGGQRQRLGLARALYATPSVLVLDEATSSLDAETERAIADTIGSLGAEVTTITVAHRLATIRNADQVVYLEDGRVVVVGTFEHVRAVVPRFERQARLLGL